MKNCKIFFSVLAIVSIGFILGWWSFDYYHNFRQVKADIKQIRQKGNYKFINPLYECEIEGEELIKKFIPFEDAIESRIAAEVQANENVQVAVYFRNLNNGPYFGINQNADFAPASLLKVPLMMAYFKKAETNPDLLNQEFIFSQHAEEDYLSRMQQISPAEHMQINQAYTVSELIRRMIARSDNEAMALLMENFSQEDLYQIYGELGVENPYGQGNGDSLSVKEYASFFRILYNAAYLNQDNSEKALALLAQADFRAGLVAGVPESISVAHKFGERELTDGDYREQLHDCGIVYYEKYPYLMCVMTRGNDKDKLVEAIKNVSRITFEEIARNYP